MTGPDALDGAAGLTVLRRTGSVCLQMGQAGQATVLSAPALSTMLRELGRLSAADGVVLLRGQAEGFCSGMDLAAIAHWPTGHSTRSLHADFSSVLQALAHHPTLTVAVVEGDAMGGGLALAAACDLVLALESARFALPELLWGLQPANALPPLVRRMGVAAARRLALLTEPIDALTAHRQGLVDFIVPDGARLEGLLRRLILRAGRMPRGGVSGLRELFDVLQANPDDYARHALDSITAITDDAEFRRKLARQHLQWTDGTSDEP